MTDPKSMSTDELLGAAKLHRDLCAYECGFHAKLSNELASRLEAYQKLRRDFADEIKRLRAIDKYCSVLESDLNERDREINRLKAEVFRLQERSKGPK